MSQFFGDENESMLNRILYTDFKRRLGTDLNEKQTDRLEKTVRHYMKEVYAKNSSAPVQYLNKEVLTAVLPDYLSYINRSSVSTAGAAGLIVNTPDPLAQDVNARFDRLQNERQESRALAPPQPDFRIPLEDNSTPAVNLFEQVRQQREAEAKRLAEMATVASPTQGTDLAALLNAGQQTTDSGLRAMMDSDSSFRGAAAAAKQRDENAIVVRNTERAMANRAAAAATAMTLEGELPDRRRVLFGDGANSLALSSPQRQANANPTFAIPTGIRDKPVLPQDILKANDDIVSYRENEYNLFVYSADRDWVNNNTENRYNFSVNFDPANNRPGFGYSTATNIKFKNITRIEFVKAIMPTEACDILPSYTGTVGSGTLGTGLNMNILSFPYLQVRIPELNTNGYGTNDGLNNAFASISYEAYWTADSTAANRGYARMIPKFLKCQKVFYPTPLATLQKLTFEIQRPDGTTVCSSKDTLDIANVYMPVTAAAGTTDYKANTFDWIWINTSTYFSRFSVSQGDRIQIKNVSLNATLAANANAAAFIAFLTRDEGHLVADIGQVVTATPSFTTGPNTVGYANGIIIRNNFSDPTTGSTSPAAWVSAIGAAVNTNPALTTGRLINLNHQIQIILRVITRDMDAATRLRPDNLQA